MGDAKDLIGMYAACVATIVFIWDVAKWFYQKPRLRIEIKTDMALDPSGKYLILDQKNAYSHDKKGIAIEIVNMGKMPTTLKFVAIQPYIKDYFFKRSKRHTNPYILSFSSQSSELPKVLNPGEIWSSFTLNQAEIFKLKNQHALILEIHHSFSKNPAIKKLMFLEDRKRNYLKF
ncbi:MAG: hypothetical protein ACK4V2_02830 [Pseudomonadota bacterium]|jgi:hypothetical protein